jgi:hypothetical protein
MAGLFENRSVRELESAKETLSGIKKSAEKKNRWFRVF